MKIKSTNAFSWRSLSLGLFAALFLSACYTPKAVIRVEPDNEDVRWQYGQAFARQQSDEVEVQAAYNGMNREYLFFDVEIINYGKEEVLVDPSRFFLDVNGFKRRAIDPEAFLLGLDMDASKRAANSKNTAIALGVVAVAATAAVIIAADKNSSGNNANANNTNNLGQDINNIGLATDVVSIFPSLVVDLSANNQGGELPPPNPNDRDFWTDFTLRKTTLRENERVTGKVLFPLTELTDRFKMVMPVETGTFRLQFKRMLHQPK